MYACMYVLSKTYVNRLAINSLVEKVISSIYKSIIFKNIHVHIIDAQFVLKVQNEHVLFRGLLRVLHDVELVNFDQVGTQLTTSFVC